MCSWRNRLRKPLKQAAGIFTSKEKGVTLIETVVALAIMAIVAVGFISGLGTTSKAGMVSEKLFIAESLAKSQMDYIRFQQYVLTADYDPGDPANRYKVIDISPDELTAGYAIEINTPVVVISPDIDEKYELQRVTVVIKQNGVDVLTITEYKMGRIN